MRDLNDKQFDQFVADHLAGELAGQEGKARKAFEDSSGENSVHRPVQFFQILKWSTGLAACAVLAWFVAANLPARLPVIGSAGGSIPTRPAGVSESAGPAWVRSEQIVDWGIIDEGPFQWIDGATVRQIRQVELQRVRYIDDQGKTVMETVIPRERVLLVDAKPY